MRTKLTLGKKERSAKLPPIHVGKKPDKSNVIYRCRASIHPNIAYLLQKKCEVACVDKKRKIWIVPRTRVLCNRIQVGFDIVGTLFTGASPQEIAFADSAESARIYLKENFGIPYEMWQPIPLLSFVSAGPRA